MVNLPSMRLIAPLLLIAVMLAASASGLTGELSWAGLARQHAMLRTWVAAHPVGAPCLFAAIYVASVALSLPQAALLTITGGLLFGAVIGGALAVGSATAGAMLLFLIARSALAEPMRRRAGPRFARLRDALSRDGFSYLLAIRLVPLFPFWLVNLAAALCGMRARDFAAATLIGMAPTTFVMASIGSGLGDVLAQGGRPDLGVLVSVPVLGPLLALALLSVTPILWRKYRGRNA